jgi:cytosine/creatinine deaminase
MNQTWLVGARLPGSPSLSDILCNGSRIEGIEPHYAQRQGTELNGALVMGALAHWHTHLDKTFTIARARQTEPGLLGAIKACDRDAQSWTSEDVLKRANAALEQSWQAGCRIVRSHVNWSVPAEPIAWSVLAELAEQWKGRIELQRVALIKGELFEDDLVGSTIAQGVKHRKGMLGAFVHSSNATPKRIANLAKHALHYDLAMDIHLDEEINPKSMGLTYLLASLDKLGANRSFPPISVSHVCALAVKPVDERSALIEGLVKANIEVIALPSTNLYLQDQSNPALPMTPSLRGIAPVHELKRAGVKVLLSCDNVQDPFYPWGSYDPIDLMHIAAPALQLVNSFDEWANATAANDVLVGQPSDFTIYPDQSATSWPAGASHRKLIRSGQLITP